MSAVQQFQELGELERHLEMCNNTNISRYQGIIIPTANNPGNKLHLVSHLVLLNGFPFYDDPIIRRTNFLSYLNFDANDVIMT